MQRNKWEREVDRDIIWAKFCVSYLPGTIDRFLDPPISRTEPTDVIEDLQLNDAYFRMLVNIQQSIFFKYLRSYSPIDAGGGKLVKTITQRFVTLRPKWNESMFNEVPDQQGAGDIKEIVAMTIQLLCTLFVIFIRDVNQTTIVAPQTRASLQYMLKLWSIRHIGEFLGELSKRGLRLLSNDPN